MCLDEMLVSHDLRFLRPRECSERMATMNTILHSVHAVARMVGTSIIPFDQSVGAKHHQSVMETSSRLRMAKSVDRGPYLNVSNQSTYASGAHTAALLGMRMRIMF
jgi:hypothetical protein